MLVSSRLLLPILERIKQWIVTYVFSLHFGLYAALSSFCFSLLGNCFLIVAWRHSQFFSISVVGPGWQIELGPVSESVDIGICK